MGRVTQDQQLGNEFAVTAVENFLNELDGISDPRRPQGTRYPLKSILLIALMAVICDINSAQGFELFGKYHEAKLSEFLDLPYGAPTQDVYLRVFAMLSETMLEKLFEAWVPVCAALQGKAIDTSHLAIDGKTSRRSNKTSNTHGIHTLGVMAVNSGILIASKDCHEKTNEIVIIPQMLELLNLKGTTVTLDAMGTQTEIASMIAARGGDYILGLKLNQKNLYADALALFEKTMDTVDKRDESVYFRDINKGHGRIEERETFVMRDLSSIRSVGRWTNMSYIAAIKRTVTKLNPKQYQKAVTVETEFYIGSQKGITAQKCGALIRAHWMIENQCHWVLDVVFDEDQARARMKNCAKNFTTLRRMALALLKSDPNHPKVSIQLRRKLAAMDFDYLLNLVGIKEN